MLVRILGIILACTSMVSCAPEADPYAPPPQRQALELQARTPKIMLAMSDPAAEYHIVQDILRTDGGNPWCWTATRPTVRISLLHDTKLKYYLDFSLSEVTLKDTGPVTVSFLVNDQLLGRQVYDSPGRHTFERKVPPGWLKPMSGNTVAAAVDKVWTSHLDGQKLGLMLTSIGLKR